MLNRDIPLHSSSLCKPKSKICRGRLRKKGREERKGRQRGRAKGKGKEEKRREGKLASKVFGGAALNPRREGKIEIVGLVCRIRIDRYIVQ